MGGRIGEGMPRMANKRLPERSIPDRSPGHAFIAMTRPARLTGAAYFRTNDEAGVGEFRHFRSCVASFSYQSRMPVLAGSAPGVSHRYSSTLLCPEGCSASDCTASRFRQASGIDPICRIATRTFRQLAALTAIYGLHW